MMYFIGETHYHFYCINFKDMLVENIKTTVLHIISLWMTLNYMLIIQTLPKSNLI